MSYSNELIQDLRTLYSNFRQLVNEMEVVPELGREYSHNDAMQLDSSYTLALGEVQQLWKDLGELLDRVDSGKYDENS